MADSLIGLPALFIPKYVGDSFKVLFQVLWLQGASMEEVTAEFSS